MTTLRRKEKIRALLESGESRNVLADGTGVKARNLPIQPCYPDRATSIFWSLSLSSRDYLFPAGDIRGWLAIIYTDVEWYVSSSRVKQGCILQNGMSAKIALASLAPTLDCQPTDRTIEF